MDWFWGIMLGLIVTFWLTLRDRKRERREREYTKPSTSHPAIYEIPGTRQKLKILNRNNH